MKTRKFLGLARWSLLAVTITAGAQSNTAAFGPEANAESPVLDEIVVTARRKNESIEDVPQVINAVTSETLTKFNIQSLQDVAPLVPGLALTNDSLGYQSKASIRGTNFEVTSATSPTVAFYMNEAPIDANFVMQSIFDVSQIEVLRGPQGTLRGRSAPSGSITVATHKADVSGFGGYVSSTGSDRHAFKGEGAVNIPIITDLLAIRFAGLLDHNRLDNVKSINSTENQSQRTSAWRASVTFEPSKAFSFAATYQHLEREVHSYSQLAGPGALGPNTVGGCRITVDAGVYDPLPCQAAGYNGPAIAPGDRLAVQNQTRPVETEYDAVIAQADYRFADQKLSYVGSYARQKWSSTEYTDSANMLPGRRTVGQLTTTEQPQSSHELRLASERPIAGLFDYSVGLFYSSEKPKVNPFFPAQYLPGAFGTPANAPSPYLLDQRYVIYSETFVSGDRQEKAAFASLTWHITDKTELTAGGRYIIATADESVDVFLRSQNGLLAFQGACPNNAGTASTYPGYSDCNTELLGQAGGPFAGLLSRQIIASKSNKRWTPKVYNASLSHHFTDDILAYLNYGTAWRRGPTAVGILTTPDPAMDQFTFLQPEDSSAWELGLKSTWLNKRLQTNLAAYRQKFDNYIYLTQYTPYLLDAFDPASVTPFRFTANVPAVSTGVDFDAAFQVTSRWNVGMAASWADGHMKNGVIPCNDANSDGVPDNGLVTPALFSAGDHVKLCTVSTSISTAPKWNANLQSEYSMPITSSMDGYVRGLFTYYPENDRASGEGSGFTAESYGILNLYTGIRSPEGNWEIQLFAKNVTNTENTLTYDPLSERNPMGPVNDNFGDSGYHKTSITPLREFGLTLRYAFGSR
jgi:iron complex outermembrane receptor protein